MPSFGELFIASKGQPIIYQGKELRLTDLLPVSSGDHLRIIFESTGSERRQGILLRATAMIRVNEKVITGPMVLWHDTAPAVVDLECRTAGDLRIKNVWDRGNGVMDSGHNGAAMIVDETPTGRRYRCNDGDPDDDFDDLIFRIDFAPP